MPLSISIPVRARQSSGIFTWTIAIALVISLVTTGQDYLSSVARQGNYYFSESLLFSSFWWIFPPLLGIQLYRAGRLNAGSIRTKIWWMVWPMAAHLMLYPLWVDMLAQLSLGYSFQWTQTLRYGLSEYAVVILAGYTLPFLAAVRLAQPGQQSAAETAPSQTEPDWAIHDAPQTETPTGQLDTIMAKEGTRTMIVPVKDVLLFAAASPYVKVHSAKRQFLVTGTLRSLSSRLDPVQFCRIHKSTIVRLDAVAEMVSRQNGDYDLILTDGSMTRLSRSYVPGFRAAFDRQACLQQNPVDFPVA